MVLGVSAQAQVVVGSWTSSGVDNGWCDYNLGNSYPADSILNSTIGFTPGAVYSSPLATESGYSSGLELSGLPANYNWNQNLNLPLTYSYPVSDFVNNNEFQITFSVTGGTGGGTPQIDNISLQTSDFSWSDMPASTLTIGNVPGQTWASDGNTVSENGGKGVGFNCWSGSPARSVTLTWNYSSQLATMLAADGIPTYVNITFQDSAGGGSNPLYFNNAEFLTAVPEPASMVLLGLGILTSGFYIRRKVS